MGVHHHAPAPLSPTYARHTLRLTVSTIPNILKVISAALLNCDKNDKSDKYMLLGKRGHSLRHLGSFRFEIQDYA